ncbi:hypothetical protein ACFY1G_06640 [Streptomyces olivaceus]|uniref:hypothetical protein n=1 Tax=Streptomyces olivaceus TaxID=47716 RepID=UPI001CC982E8|nr:hypothetical protein [Streptomyces olivaceus]MBZ6194162.1 hypothetical protein [Streptomyces olivaceus]MBZ6200945.1 hypothetical protein [Streptomyces olivaceus]MBZ6205158.1 hypothetical protein [Streptomyces olivaceus]
MAPPPNWQPDQPYGQPPTIIINNSAAAIIGGAGLRRRRQSLWVHFWLMMLTAGIGNVFYAVHVSRWNRHRSL